MRFVLVAAASALLAACATTQETAKPATAAAPAAAPAAAAEPADRFATINAENLVDAQKAGYKVVNDKGKKLLCRRDHPTGTRLKEVTTCLTPEEWSDARRNAREALDKPIPKITGPNGG